MRAKRETALAGKASRAAFAFVLAAGMSWPCGLALAAEDVDGATPTEETSTGDGGQAEDPGQGTPVDSGGGAASEPAPEPEPEPEPVEPEPAAPEPSEPSSDTPDPASPEPAARDNEKILQAAREAELDGVDALEKWLNGETLTDEELVSIDLEGLKAIDEDLANEIRPAQEEAKERIKAAEEKKAADDEDADESDDADGKKKNDSPKSKYPEWTYEGDTSAPPTYHGPSLETAKFVAVVGESARKLAGENDLYASVMIAQAIMESESGTTTLAHSPNFNLFCMEGSYHGESVTLPAHDFDVADDGEQAEEPEQVDYRKYPSYEASMQDYVDLLSRASYKQVHKSETEDYKDACKYLEGSYSDWKMYSETLQRLISDYDLTRYDEPLGYELANESDADLSDLVIHAADNLGKPYVWGATGPSGYDCSGLVVSSYSSVLGVQLPRTTYYQCLTGEDVDFADLHMGDLLFFTNSLNEADHVAMYVGEGCYIESTTPGGVQVTALSEHMPTFAKRMLPTRES